MARKVFASSNEALDGLLANGITLMVGGFGLCGVPQSLCVALRDSAVTDLTCISNNAGTDGAGLGLLLQTRQVTKMIASYVGENKLFERQYLDGILEVELNPQGTLAERIRAGGAGIGAFFTPTSAGTMLSEDKETRLIEGIEHVLEYPIKGDVALILGKKADRWGNVVYEKSARNFSPIMAMAAETTIVQVQEIVELGLIDPELIVTPGIFVDRVIVKNSNNH